MSTKEKIVKRRLYASSVSTIISISLVLFMLGLVGLIILTSENLSIKMKENIGFHIYLKEHTKEVDIIQIQKYLESMNYVKSARFKSKEEAKNELQQDLDPDEDFTTLLDGHNPLPASIDIILNAEYANPDSITWIEEDVMQYDVVNEFKYDSGLLHLINANVAQISMFILGFGALLFLIAMALINNTIRLVIYSQRFTIRTMQLVGATRGFIRRPFILKGIIHGIMAAIIANAFLAGSLYITQQEMPELMDYQDIQLIGTIFAGVIICGILISWISTLFAVRKYLKLKTDELYF